jgi:hypothetical protein
MDYCFYYHVMAFLTLRPRIRTQSFAVRFPKKRVIRDREYTATESGGQTNVRF